MKIKALIIILLLLVTPNIFSQEPTNSSLTYACGVGISDASNYVGSGLALQIGYSRNIFSDRLRLQPNILVGAYRAEGIQDVREQYFNSVSMRLSVNYDVLRYKIFSFNIETGGLVNATRGLIGTGGEYNITESEYVNHWNYGIIMAGGFKIAPRESKIAIKIMPLNIHMGLDYFLEMHALAGIEIKL